VFYYFSFLSTIFYIRFQVYVWRSKVIGLGLHFASMHLLFRSMVFMSVHLLLAPLLCY